MLTPSLGRAQVSELHRRCPWGGGETSGMALWGLLEVVGLSAKFWDRAPSRVASGKGDVSAVAVSQPPARPAAHCQNAADYQKQTNKQTKRNTHVKFIPEPSLQNSQNGDFSLLLLCLLNHSQMSHGGSGPPCF